MMSRNIYVTPQPPPLESNATIIADTVIADMQDRKKFGFQKYSSYLRANNGRYALIDLYQELLDACV